MAGFSYEDSYQFVKVLKMKILLVLLLSVVPFFEGYASSSGEKTASKKKNPEIKLVAPITLQELKEIFENSKTKLLDDLVSLWQTRAPFSIKFNEIQASTKGHSVCHDNAKEKSWIQWRDDSSFCHDEKLPDDFRRLIVKQMNEASSGIIAQLSGIQTRSVHHDTNSNEAFQWAAIGTPGPASDIDTVANCKCCHHGNIHKIVAETYVKSLFDALGVALYMKPTGVVFDTESYIDVTGDLKKEPYLERTKGSDYQNLAFTLGFVQIVRQLSHDIRIGEGSSQVTYTYADFANIWKDPFGSMLTDAKAFECVTKPNSDAKENIREYLPIINHLAKR